MDVAKRQTRLAGARDSAVRNLRDLTIAIAIIAAAGVGLAAWVSAATIPGNTPPGSSGNASTGAASDSFTTDPGNGQAAVSSQPGSAVVVSGGSR
jgi:hypothetical protein